MGVSRRFQTDFRFAPRVPSVGDLLSGCLCDARGPQLHRHEARHRRAGFQERLIKNTDGSVDLYIGPEAPKGKELTELYSLELHLDRWSTEHGLFLKQLTNLQELTLVTPPGPWDDRKWLVKLRELPQLKQVCLCHVLPDGRKHDFPQLTPPFE
jgi:hypothetical protein